MTKALLIIDVQVSAVTKPDLPQKIEALQKEYDTVFVSIFKERMSFLPRILNKSWIGYINENLAFKPKTEAIVFEKGTYSSFLPEMKTFDEIHLCGFDTDACIYKTEIYVIAKTKTTIRWGLVFLGVILAQKILFENKLAFTFLSSYTSIKKGENVKC